MAITHPAWQIASHELAHILCGTYHLNFPDGDNHNVLAGNGDASLTQTKEDIPLLAWQAYEAHHHARMLAARYNSQEVTNVAQATEAA